MHVIHICVRRGESGLRGRGWQLTCWRSWSQQVLLGGASVDIRCTYLFDFCSVICVCLFIA